MSRKAKVHGYDVTYDPLTVRDVMKADGNPMALLPLAIRRIVDIHDPQGLALSPQDLPSGVMQQVMALMQQ